MSFDLGPMTRVFWVAVKIMVVLTLVLGVAYPVAVTAVGAVVFPGQARGSLVTDGSGRVVGSSLLGQSFADESGMPLRQYFQPRPSAAGDAGYDGRGSSGSNLGPENPELVAAIKERRAAVAELNGVPESAVPADAVTASGSGLDPDISPEYASLQVRRVAEARGLPVDRVEELVAEHTSQPVLPYLGPARVNVLELNLALDADRS